MSKLAIYATAICISLTMVFANETTGQRRMLKDIPVEIGSNETISLQNLIDKVESSSQFTFVYSKRDVKNVAINLGDQYPDMEELLREISTQARLSIRRVNETISLKRVADNDVPYLTEKVIAEQLVRGTITDEKGETLPGASVVIKGSTNGTTTDIDGNFQLNAPEDATLIVSFVGYKSQEIPINNRTVIDVRLASDLEQLEEIVVVGYGSIKKENLTGAVAQITDKGILDRPIANLGEAFQGQLAGVRAQSTSGRPGEDLTIQIRGVSSINGSSSPLYVIDGVPRDDMSDINPKDIASVQILKDAASTAIYGARGGNGVVVIQTKRGTGKPSFTFDSFYGFSRSDNYLDMMKGPEYVAYQMYRRNLDYLRQGGSMSDDPTTRSNAGQRIPDFWTSETEFTDWQRAVLQDAPIQSYNLSASTKGDMGDIYFSAGYMDQQGILVFSGSKRLNARFNATMNVSDKMRIGVLSSASNNRIYGEDGNTKDRSLHSALNASTLMGLDQGTQSLGRPTSAEYGQTPVNPYEELRQTKEEIINTKMFTSFWGEYEIIDGLVFKSQFAGNYDGRKFEYFRPGDVNGGNSRGQSDAQTDTQWSIQNTLTYKKSFGGNNVDVVVGQAAQQNRWFKINLRALTGYPYETIETLGVVPAANLSQQYTRRSTYSNASFFGRINYDFQERYLISINARYDASSRFGDNNRWGLFPAVSVGWKINEESFMQGIGWIDLLKPRVSYGITGNDRIDDYRFEALLSTETTSWGNQTVSGVAPANIANPDLKWEATKSMDIGLDFNGFKNRVQLSLGYYVKTTQDLLFSVSIPSTTGFGSYWTNLGSVENKGVELDLNTYNIDFRGFQWTTNLNLSKNTNKVLDMGGLTALYENRANGSFVTELGGPISQFYALKSNGLMLPQDFDGNGNPLVPSFPGAPEGSVKYVDQNNDGEIDIEDYIAIGNNTPDLLYGFTNKFSWKNFSLSVLLQGQIGGDVMWEGSRSFDGTWGNVNVLNHWLRSYKPDYEALYGEGENPIPTDYINKHDIDMSWDGVTPNVVGSLTIYDDRRIYNASYLRVKNITFSYTVPEKFLNKVSLQSFRAYASVDNLKTFTDYPGFNPETNSYGNSNTRMGVDYVTYPLSKRFVVGLVATF